MITILFADENDYMREYVRQELEDEGYRVFLAGEGEEAVDAAQSECPDLAIFDIWMPRINGLEVAERIATIDPGIHIIFFTNHDGHCLLDPRSRFATACVEKGYDLSDLKRAIASILTSRDGKGLFRRGLPPMHKRESVLAAAGCGSV